MYTQQTTTNIKVTYNVRGNYGGQNVIVVLCSRMSTFVGTRSMRSISSFIKSPDPLLPYNKQQKRLGVTCGGRYSKLPSFKAILVDAIDQHCLRDIN